MEKTFDTLAKAMKYIELDIEGSFGQKGTYSDFMNHTKNVISYGNRIGKKFNQDWQCFVSVFKDTTNWSLDESMLRSDLEIYKKFGRYCRYIFMISKRDGLFKVESYPIPIDIE